MRNLAGCILPDQTHARAAPNGSRSILRPTEHAAIHIKPSYSKRVEATTNVTVNSLAPNKKGEMVTKESVSLKARFGETSITVKHNTRLKLLHVGRILEPKISLYSECKDNLDVSSKKFCFKPANTGVNKLVSNNVLSNVEINNCKVAQPPKVQLNKSNISEQRSAILKAFKESNDVKNSYAMLNKHYGKYYSIQQHTGIFLGTKWMNDTNYIFR